MIDLAAKVTFVNQNENTRSLTVHLLGPEKNRVKVANVLGFFQSSFALVNGVLMEADEDGLSYDTFVGGGTYSLSLVRADEVRDESEAWIKHMLLPCLPELPRNRGDLTNVLFPPGQQQKLPVTKEFFRIQTAYMPALARERLIEADGSAVPCAVSSFLRDQRSNIDMDTTIFVAHYFRLFFDLFDEYTKSCSNLTLAFNSTEKRLHGHSGTTEVQSRPDTILISSGCTFLVGEDKLNDLHAAEMDLRTKIGPLNPMYYGELNFIVGYIAAVSQLQWVYIGRNGSRDIHCLGSPFNLSRLLDRCSFLFSLGYLFQLIQRMVASVPDVPGRRAMFSIEESSSKKRTSYFYATKVVKHIRDFYSLSAEQGTSLIEIQRAYDVARGSRFLLQAEKGPSVSTHGTYKVECTPLGYACSLETEEDCRWMAQSLCQALCIFHRAGLLHRDIRLPNIVRLSKTEFMLIDFESVTESPFRLPEGFQWFRGWCPEMLEGNFYTPYSDMFSLGRVLEKVLPYEKTLFAEQFLRKLANKQLSAADALQDSWLTEPLTPPVLRP